MKRIVLFICFTVGLTVSLSVSAANSYHVKTNGTANGNGSIDGPWNLQTALNHPSRVNAGDTIWIHEGVYTGVFISKLSGTQNAPIIVRAVPDEEVIIDGNVNSTKSYVLSLEGQYTWIWGLTILNTNGNRINSPEFPIDNKDGVAFLGANNKLINCIIRDNGGGGVGLWQSAINSEIYGCIIYHNGYIGNERGHGHGVYIQNETGTKLVTDNIIFNSFGIGIHAYSENGQIKGYNIDGNILFNCGLPGADFLERHILVGGYQPADRVKISNNYLYNRPLYSSKAMIQLGYDVSNKNISLTDNYMVNGSFYVDKPWESMTFTNNSVMSTSSDMALIAFKSFANIQNPELDYNTYHNGKFYNNYNNGTLSNYNFNGWQSFSGQDSNSSYNSKTPSSTFYYFKENRYEKGKTNLVIYNWEKSENVDIDVSDLLSIDDEYELWDVQNLSRGPVKTGKYDGSFSVPMNLKTIDLPYGNIPNTNKYYHTAPAFGVFIIKKVTSDVVSNIVSQKNDFSFVLYPNPAANEIYADIIIPFSGMVEIGVYDISGRIVKSEKIEVNAGKNKYSCNLEALETGLYLFVVSSKEAGQYSKIFRKK